MFFRQVCLAIPVARCIVRALCHALCDVLGRLPLKRYYSHSRNFPRVVIFLCALGGLRCAYLWAVHVPVGAARWRRPGVGRGERSRRRTSSGRPAESPRPRTERPCPLPRASRYPLLYLLLLLLTTGDPGLPSLPVKSPFTSLSPPVVFTLIEHRRQSAVAFYTIENNCLTLM